MKSFVGVDVGGTNTVCGVVDEHGKLIYAAKQATEAPLGERHVIDRIGAFIKDTIDRAGVSREDVLAVGIGTPGLVDPVKGITLLSANLGWHHVYLADAIHKIIDIPVYVDNDVRMYVLGEVIYGAGRSYNNVLGLTVGTGLAASIIYQGKLFYGGGNMSGELGHLQFAEIPYVCGCGKTGCLETIVSATGMVRQVREQLNLGRVSLLSDGPVSSHAISAAYDQNDALAIDIMNYTGKMLGKGLVQAIHLLDPDLILIGGGVAAAGHRLLEPMMEHLQESLLTPYLERITVTLASLEDDAGVLGSAYNARQRLLG